MARNKPKNRIKRLYPGSDAELIQRATDLKVMLTEDLSELNTEGISAARITALGTMTQNFDALPTLETAQLALANSYTARESAYELVVKAVDKARTMIINVFGEESDIYRLRYAGIFSLPDVDFIQKVKDIIEELPAMLSTLADEGLTQAFIDDLTAKNTAFADSVTGVNNAIKIASEATDNRTIAGNTLWKEIMKRVKSAVTYYKYTNSQRADEYTDLTRRDDTPATPPPAPENVAVDVATGEVTYEPSANATSYKIEYKSPADSGTFVPAHEGLITTTSFTLPVQLVAYIIRVFAHNAAGFSPPSAEVLASFGLATPGGFAYDSAEGKFVWVMLAGITFYRMEASYDGGITWQEISAQDFIVGEYVWNPPPGIFRLRAEDGSEVSAWTYATVA